MGNKTNLFTLRPEYTFNSSRLDINEFLYTYFFLNSLEFLFIKKKVFLTNSNLLLFNNKIFLTLFIFFRVAKIFKFLKFKKIKSNNFFNPVIKKKSFTFLLNSFKTLKINLLIYTVVNLNFFLRKNKKKICLLFKSLKRIAVVLFPRRFRFFLDFIQISVLFLKQKISTKFLLKNLVDIFRMLQKKLHAKFLNFVSHYFKLLLFESKNLFFNKFNLKGLKFIIAGKLKGKPRSTKYIFTTGRVPIQTMDCIIDYAKDHAFTIYGVFGFKLWLYR